MPDLVLTEAFVGHVRDTLPELPQAKAKRYVSACGLTEYDARVLTDDAEVAALFESALGFSKHYKLVANWIINEVLREVKDKPISSLPFGGEAIGELVALIEDGTISGKIAKDVFALLMRDGGSARAIVKRENLAQVSDAGALQTMVDAVIQEQADSVERYRGGRVQVLGFLVGQVMQKSRGQANPKMVSDLLVQRIGAVS